MVYPLINGICKIRIFEIHIRTIILNQNISFKFDPSVSIIQGTDRQLTLVKIIFIYMYRALGNNLLQLIII